MRKNPKVFPEAWIENTVSIYLMVRWKAFRIALPALKPHPIGNVEIFVELIHCLWLWLFALIFQLAFNWNGLKAKNSANSVLRKIISISCAHISSSLIRNSHLEFFSNELANQSVLSNKNSSLIMNYIINSVFYNFLSFHVQRLKLRCMNTIRSFFYNQTQNEW